MAAFSTLKDRSRDRLPYETMLQQAIFARNGATERLHGYVGDENTPPAFEKRLLYLFIIARREALLFPVAEKVIKNAMIFLYSVHCC